MLATPLPHRRVTSPVDVPPPAPDIVPLPPSPHPVPPAPETPPEIVEPPAPGQNAPVRDPALGGGAAGTPTWH